MPAGCAFTYVAGSRGLGIYQKENEMRVPSSIATWCMILFFLFFGLSLLGLAIPNVLIGLLAVGAAVFTLIGR